MAFIIPQTAFEETIEVTADKTLSGDDAICLHIGAVGKRLAVIFRPEEFRDLMKQGAVALQAVSEKEVA